MNKAASTGSILAPDDLEVGCYVAVHSETRTKAPVDLDSASMQPRIQPELRNPCPLGIPLKIRAVSLPFAACAILQPGGGHTGPLILDLRTVRLVRVSRQYVRAIATFHTPNGAGGELPGIDNAVPASHSV